MTPDKEATQLAELAALLEGGSAPVTGERIALQGLELLPEAEWASLTIRHKGSYATLGASSPIAAELDESQYKLGEGPCVEAYQEAEWFRSGDVAHDPRWRVWGPHAAATGASSVLSIRMLSQGKPIGAMNYYSPHPSAFGDRDVIDHAVLFATHAAIALTSARKVEQLETAVSSRHAIGMAQGFLIERYKITPNEAFDALRRLSSIHNVKLRDLAQTIITTGKVPLTRTPPSTSTPQQT